jgi:arginine/lysine/ornithine decarboxylase
LIHDTTLKRQNSANEISSGVKPAQSSKAMPQSSGLADAISRHIAGERASFHTPGHKGRPQAFGKDADFVLRLDNDLTELPGLDDLSSPSGVLRNLEDRLAKLFGAHQSFLSVSGASACVMAAMMAASSVTGRILVPTNLHRSAVSGLALSKLEPVWYQPAWNADFGFFEQVDPAAIERALSESDAGALLIVSPTYGGAISDIANISAICKERGVLLIVDEAHGAHLLDPQSMPLSALSCGADIVIHSLHKTLPGLTQTGVLHIAHGTRFSLDHMRGLLTCLQSSSPSYPLMASVQYMVDFVETPAGMQVLKDACAESLHLRKYAASSGRYDLYASAAIHEPLHVVLRPRFPIDLADQLQSRGVGVEANFHQSVLFMLGMGTEPADVILLLSLLAEFAERAADRNDELIEFPKYAAPPLFQQAIGLSDVFSMPSYMVPVEDAAGRICAECIAPCPPGTPVVVPGQLLTSETIAYVLQNTGIRSLRVAQNQIV